MALNKDFRVKNGLYASSLNTTGVTSTSAVSFEVGTDAFTVSAGQMAWNPIDFTLDMGVNDNVTLQLGQEQLMHVKGGVNETIRNGMVVYAGGTIGGSDLIGVSAWSSDFNFQDEVYMIGLATEELTGNVDGFATTFGRVRGLDGNEYSSGGIREDGTPAWNVGEILYPAPSLSARGTLTNVPPISPNHSVPVAWVTKIPAISNITLTVRANGAAGEALESLHDVRFDLPLEDGALLSYNDSLSVWQNVDEVGVTSLSTTGDIVTTGDILSAGVNIDQLFGSGGGGGGSDVGDLSANWEGTYNTVSSLSGDWNSTHTTVQGESANWDAAYDWCTVNGDNVIDTVAEGAAQAQIAVTDISNTTSQVDVNGLGTTDSPTFAGATAGAVEVGLGDNNTITTSSGDLTIDSTSGETVVNDNLSITGSLNLSGIGTGTSNSVLVKQGTNIVTDEVDSRVWGTTLVDATAATVNKLTKFCDANGIIDSNITDDGNSIQISGGLSATGTLSGDGSGLTGVTATPSFPTVGTSNLATADKIFVNDGASCEVACNKHITYGNLLTDLAGTAIEVEGSDSLALKNASSLSDQAVLKWDDGNGQLTDSIISETALGNVTIAGGATVTGNLSVQGDLTCVDTLIQTTSAVCINNAGTGPALYAEQTGASQPIAQFVDTEGGQVVIGDTGNVGIGTIGTAPAEKLTVSGNISANGDLSVDGTTSLSGTVNIALGTSTDNTVVINTPTGLATDEIDSKVWDGSLVDYGTSTSNALPKFTDGTGTVGDSNVADNGSLVTVSSDLKVNDGQELQIFTSDGVHHTAKKTFTATVSGGDGYNLPTFPKTNLTQAKYEVTLINGANITAFEINAVYNGIEPCGTVYALVDAQATSQLVGAAITSANTTIDLELSAATSGTTAIVHGTALY